MAIAEHHPEKLHKENRGLLSMSHSQLHDFASTSESHLPASRGRKGMAVLARKVKHNG